MERLLKEQTDTSVDTVKTRVPSTAILAVNSIDRYPDSLPPDSLALYSSPYDFTINAPQPFISGFFTRAALSEVNFPMFLTNINVFSQKMYIWYKKGNGALTQYLITIPVGFYDYDDIASELQQSVRTAVNVNDFDVTYVDYQYAADCNAADRFFFAPYYLPSFPFQRGLYEMMNWSTSAYAADGKALLTNYTSGVPSLLFTKYVDIVCDSLTSVQDVKDSSTSQRNKNVLCRLYFDSESSTFLDPDKSFGASPFRIYRDYNTPKQVKWEQTLPIGSLRFQVYNDCGYILSGQLPYTAFADPVIIDLQDGELPDFQLTLLISEQ
jgi:hypothetical protein